MAQILPLRAWRYNIKFTNDIETLTSPLFDVVSEKQRTSLYNNPLNSIHLSVPHPPYASERAALLLKEWKQKSIIIQDKLPGIYVYYQYFKLAGSSKEYCRKGFVCNIRIYDWAEQVILRHENTIPKSVNDRIELLEKTELNVSPTHGLYTDPHFELEKIMDEAITNPVYETEDYQGVRDVMAVINDGRIIHRFITTLKNQNIILADGHHRYEGSLANMYVQKRANPNHTGREGYNFHMMYLSNTESDDIKILPTHRIVKNIPNFNEALLLETLQENFTLKPIEDITTTKDVITGKPWTFGLLLKDRAFKMKLKPESIKKLHWPFPEEVKSLDLTIMHYFIIEKALNIPGKEQRRSEHLEFNRSFYECYNLVMQKHAQLAIITNEVSIEDVKRICKSGYTMPQKSTYFYPKIITGFLFSTIKEEEFKMPVYAPFSV